MRGGWAGLGIAALVSPVPAAQQAVRSDPPPAEAQNDIVIVAHKLKTLRLAYAVRGPRLEYCAVEVSTGDALIDQTGCAVLRGCIHRGGSGRWQPEACVRRAFDDLEPGERIAYRPDPPPVVEAAAPPEPSPAPATAQERDIIVTGLRPEIAPGKWVFGQRGWSFGGARLALHPRQRWQLCVADDAGGETVARMLTGRSGEGAARLCEDWKVRISGDRISGDMKCTTKDFRTVAQLSGSFSPDTINIIRQNRTTVRRDGTESQNQSQIVGKRDGDCR